MTPKRETTPNLSLNLYQELPRNYSTVIMGLLLRRRVACACVFKCVVACVCACACVRVEYRIKVHVCWSHVTQKNTLCHVYTHINQ